MSVHTLAAGKIVLLPVLVKPSSMNPIQIVTKNPLLVATEAQFFNAKAAAPLASPPQIGAIPIILGQFPR